jgi:hypothetical protein
MTGKPEVINIGLAHLARPDFIRQDGAQGPVWPAQPRLAAAGSQAECKKSPIKRASREASAELPPGS